MVEYKGDTYNLCCSMCIKEFNNDPEKYSRIAKRQAKGD
jgi:YHS domain-containing protein